MNRVPPRVRTPAETGDGSSNTATGWVSSNAKRRKRQANATFAMPGWTLLYSNHRPSCQPAFALLRSRSGNVAMTERRNVLTASEEQKTEATS